MAASPSTALDDAEACSFEPQRDERQDVLVVVRAEDHGPVAHDGTGRSTTNVVPAPSVLSTPMRPPCASTIALEM